MLRKSRPFRGALSSAGPTARWPNVRHQMQRTTAVRTVNPEGRRYTSVFRTFFPCCYINSFAEAGKVKFRMRYRTHSSVSDRYQSPNPSASMSLYNCRMLETIISILFPLYEQINLHINNILFFLNKFSEFSKSTNFVLVFLEISLKDIIKYREALVGRAIISF